MATILIVEDDPIAMAVAEEALVDRGYDLLTAPDGIEAQKILQEQGDRVRVVLLDWVMPRMNGMELLAWIKENPDLEHVEVILQSGLISASEVEKGLQQGACFFLSKPFEIKQLRAVARAAVANSRVKESLLEKVRQARSAFHLVVSAILEFSTIKEAESLAARIAENCGHSGKSIGLFEILANAVEHGNLGITYEEKGELLSKGEYEAELERRGNLPENRQKRVRIELSRSEEAVELTVTDTGPGFDYQRFLEFDSRRLFDSHGRGILMANAMLQLEYIPPGNKVMIRVPILSNAER